MEKQPIEVVPAHEDGPIFPAIEELEAEDGMALAEVHSTYLQLENQALKMQLQLNEALKEFEKVSKQFQSAVSAVKQKYNIGEKDNINPVTRKIHRAS